MKNVLQELRKANLERCSAFGHTVDEKALTFWSTALGGECGELLNFIKKLDRGDEINFQDICDECADVIIYLDLICIKLGIDLELAIVTKFNKTSDRVHSPVKI
jgi:NTP pyrophosphatase (non-canonical NTP hydrolase)